MALSEDEMQKLFENATNDIKLNFFKEESIIPELLMVDRERKRLNKGKEMEMNGMEKGNWFILEGVNGVGKSTIIKNLLPTLQDFISNEEPYNKNLIKGFEECTDRIKVFKYLTSMAISMDEFIKPNLNMGHNILTSRGIVSTLAYQGANARFDMSDIMKLYNTGIVSKEYYPTAVIMIDRDIDDIVTSLALRDGVKDKATLRSKVAKLMDSYNFALEFFEHFVSFSSPTKVFRVRIPSGSSVEVSCKKVGDVIRDIIISEKYSL